MAKPRMPMVCGHDSSLYWARGMCQPCYDSNRMLDPKHKETRATNFKIWKAKNIEYLRTYTANWIQTQRHSIDNLKNKPCMDCGNSYPPCAMDFDHVRGKKSFNIGSLAYGRKLKWETVLAEIAKCDLVCANCHRVRTHT